MSTHHVRRPINPSPLFESAKDWGPGFSLATGDWAGVVVGPGNDNPNVFTQTFAVNSQKYYRLLTRAISLSDPPGSAQFQVNWLAENGSFISSSKKYFEISNKEVTTEECRVSVPNGAVTGLIYLVPGSIDNRVQYFEMSLYLGLAPRPRLNFINHSGLTKGRPSLVHSNNRNTNRPEDFWARFNTNIPLCFIHIPKTAGHSIYSLFERAYPKDALVIPYSGSEGNIDTILNLTPKDLEKVRAFAGHMPFGLHNYISDCNYLTFLRNPYELLISGYYFNLESAGAPTHAEEILLNRSLLEFAEANDNVMTRFLMNCAWTPATSWLSGEINPNIKCVSYLGLDCKAGLTVRTVAIQKLLSSPTRSPRSLSPVVIDRVAVECSNDKFELDVRLVAELDLKQGINLHSYRISNVSQGRYWRIRILSNPETPRWGVVALKFFEQDVSAIPTTNYEHLVIRGVPLCSSAADNHPALQAFDEKDQLAQWQVPLNTLEIYHCEEAMNNLRERFLVGLTENFDQSIRIMSKALNFPFSAGEKRNASTILRDKSILSDYEKKQIAEINRYDFLLYQYARRLFQSDLEYFRTHKI